MAVKIFIKRHFKEGHQEKGIQRLHTSRERALRQPGYISGETLVNHYDGACVTVVSTWQSVDDWVSWQNSSDRHNNEEEIESLLDKPTTYEIYDIYQSRD